MKKISLCFSFLLISVLVFGQKYVKHTFTSDNGINSATYRSVTFNGSWCWFSDPRAVYFEGRHKRTYIGWIDNYGDVQVGYYDYTTKEIRSALIYDNLEIDDHNNPSILIDSEGYLLVFFNLHGGGMFFTKSKTPEDITAWHKVKQLKLNDTTRYTFGRNSYTYTNPIQLQNEQNRIYLFWRGIDGKPTYSVSNDNGDTWSKGVIFCQPKPSYSFRRPYTKYYSKGKSKIHIAITDGHPRKEPTNSIYYMRYENGAFFRADGTKIRDMNTKAHQPRNCDVVYDADAGNHKAWIWDIAEDEKGNPVIVYAKFPDDSTHVYCYAKWDGKKWNNYDLINSGKWFPVTKEGHTESEPNYSGGISIDKENTNILYLSINRDSVFEIEKWITKNGGKKWKVHPVTAGSGKDNIRPAAIRGAAENNPLQVLWMQNSRYVYFAYPVKWQKNLQLNFNERFLSAIKMDMPSPEIKNPLTKKGITDIMRKTADWQLANPWEKRERTDWHWGAFYTGLRALYEVTGQNRYKNAMINTGQAYNWQPLDDIFHADRLTIIDNWAWLYGLEQKPEMIDKARWALDIHLARRYKKATDVRFKNNPYNMEWWTWCDALFMAPPSFVQMWKVTGEDKYLTYMDTQWWKTSDYLYSNDDSLYYRDDRYFDKRTENDKKIFWARGNGWVVAGLARILNNLPDDYVNRKKFEQQYRQMAQKLLSIQDNDGLWRVSLADPEYLNIGESSGSAFFTFALAWGINHGLLDEKYKPQVKKAWTALCNNVNRNGRLGYVQQVAGDPYPFYEHQWHVYATGAFLLAGKQMIEIIE